MLSRRQVALAGLGLAASLLVSSCGGGQAPPDRTADLAHINRVFEKVFSRVARDGAAVTRASRIYAYVSLAMLNAQAVADPTAAALLERVDRFVPPDAPSGLDPDIAAVAAAASVARAMFPSGTDRSSFGQFRDSAVAAMSRDMDRTTVSRSLSFAARVAARVLSRAGNDGSSEPDAGAGPARRFFRGTVKCGTAPPPEGADPRSPFEEAAADVRSVSAELTDLQRSAARFWDDNSEGAGTVPGHWVNIALAASATKNRSVARTVTVVAAVSMAMADAVSGAWGAKQKWQVERPEQVIQQSDPTWRPYLETPASSAYPSDHSAASRAAADILTRFLGEMVFGDPGYGHVRSARREQGTKKRFFESFRAASDQAGMSRLYAGTDYRMSIRAGERLGGCVALKVLTGLPK